MHGRCGIAVHCFLPCVDWPSRREDLGEQVSIILTTRASAYRQDHRLTQEGSPPRFWVFPPDRTDLEISRGRVLGAHLLGLDEVPCIVLALCW